jgi:hypothetical protein
MDRNRSGRYIHIWIYTAKVYNGLWTSSLKTEVREKQRTTRLRELERLSFQLYALATNFLFSCAVAILHIPIYLQILDVINSEGPAQEQLEGTPPETKQEMWK